MQIGVANGIPLNDVITGDDLVPAYDQSTGTEGYVNLTTAVQKAFSGSAAGTANGVLYLDGSKVATSGSALTFDGTNVGIGTSSPATRIHINGTDGTSGLFVQKSGAAQSFFGAESTWLGTGTSSNTVMATYGSTSLLFGIAGSEQMRLTSTGLGIGTSSPGAKLEASSATNGDTLRISFPSPADGVSGGGIQFRAFTNVAELVELGRIQTICVDGSAAYGGVMRFMTAYAGTMAERARIDSAGNLGLGVTPSAWGSSYKVFQNPAGGIGANSTTSIAYAQNAYNSGTGAWKYLNTGAAGFYNQYLGQHAWFTAPSGTAGDAISFTQAMTLDANGRLGIGTTSPVTQLHVSGAGGQTIKITSTSAGTAKLTLEGTGGGAGSITSASAGLYLSADDASLISLSVNGSERARIDSSGNLLVGKTSIANNVAGLRLFNDETNGGQIRFSRQAGTATQYAAFFYEDGGGAVGSISTTATATSYNTSSDYRLKNITGPITNSGAYIDSLNPVEGTWKADGSTFVGLIAHEVQEVSRTSIATGVKDGEEMQAMDYSSAELIANLIAEVKSLRARVAALEA